MTARGGVTWRIPVDSAEAAEFREQEDDHPGQPVLHDPRCEAGWLGYDDDERPIPCLRCRPHLTPKPRDVSNP